MIQEPTASTVSGRRRFRFKDVVERLLLLLVAATVLLPDSHAAELKAAVPIDPIEGILREYESHDVVALSEGRHNNEQAHAFRLQLIRDPKISDVVNDIVVECGNARYQSLIDRYMQGEQIPRDELKRVWHDTTVANEVWDVPIYEEFFRAVRELNMKLPPDRRVRVLLGDPPIDWDTVKSRQDWLRWLGQRDSYPASLIEREVVAKHRKALVVYGEGHFMRKNVFWNLSDKEAALQRFQRPIGSLAVLLERAGVRVFSIYTNTLADLAKVEPNVQQWSAPKLALVAGTSLDRFFPWEMYTVNRETGIEERVQADSERSPKMSEQFDAILYLGPSTTITMSKLPASSCADDTYMSMRERRALIVSTAGAADLKRYCEQLEK